MADAEPSEYTMDSWWPIRQAFLKLWPGVSSERTHMVLREASDLGTPGIQELLIRALDLGGSEAADLLMAPVAATFPFPDYRSRPRTVHAIDALIRAGGDPTPALTTLADALKDRHCRGSAVNTLRRAALAGTSLDSIRTPLETLPDPDGEVATIRRLAFLQHPDGESAIASLQRVHKNQPMGNLRTGIGLVEQLLSSDSREDQALGDAVLVALQEAGKDAYRSWLALLPAIHHLLATGSVDQKTDALETLSQFTFTPKYAIGLTEHVARAAAVPTLERTLGHIVPHLAAPNTRVPSAAAKALKVLAEAGASLESVRAEVDDALDHSHVSVRSACSVAVTLHLRRTGDEPELASNAYYRRTYAPNDEPVNANAPGTCALCGAAETRLIYSEDDGAQFYRQYTSETHCSACGRYFPTVFRAPG